MIGTTTSATTVFKLASYPMVASFFVYTGVNQEAMFILAGLLALDIFTAIVRVWVTDPKALSSRVGIIGVISKCFTFCIPFVVAIVGKGAGIDMTHFIEVAVGAFIVYEGWSVLSNIAQIREKDATIAEYDAISLSIKSMQNLLKQILSKVYKP